MDSIVNQIKANCTKGGQNPNNSIKEDQSAANRGLGAYGHQYMEGSAGHQSILESHANSGVNALIYIGVVLLLYIIFMAIIVMRYVLMKSNFKQENPNTPYYFGGHHKNVGGTTTTTATTTLGGASVSNYGCGGPTSVYIEGEETPPEIRFIETEL